MWTEFLVLGLAALPISASPLQARASSVAPNPPVPTELVTDFDLSPTAAERILLLKAQGSRYWKYDFNPSANSKSTDAGVFIGEGGQGVLANRVKFPAVISLGISASMGFFSPCGMNTPHVHPRATEFLTIASVAPGGHVHTGFIMENGAGPELSNDLTMYQGTVFPQGSVHYEFNDNCEPATFIAGFNSEDPGLSSIAQNFFDLNPDIVEADLGYPREINGENIAKFAPTIPPSFALGIKSCLDRCGITYKPYNGTASGKGR